MLASAIDAKGDYFPGHSDGVAYLATMMAVELDYGPLQVSQLQWAGLLHDLGKALIPDAILGARRKLTPGEYEVMKRHSEWGAMIVSGIDGLDFMVPWIRHHHEHFDGSGYPDGLKGEAIPWESRLLLVADAFNVMTSVRPYSGMRSREEAHAEILRCTGTQFCPAAVEALTRGRVTAHIGLM